jgi:YebC/PmpR family DNA-binding regulatory protein
MAGHSHAANVAHRKKAQGDKKAKIFTKFLREIQVAAKSGGVNESTNSRLKIAIAKAKSVSVPRDKIESLLKKVAGGEDLANYEEVRYDGYAPGGIGVIVECLSDNKNRTASDVRSTFTKYSGNLGETGSLNFLFNRCGVIYFKNTVNFDDLFEEAINLNSQNINQFDDYYEVITEFEDFIKIKQSLEKIFQSENIENSGLEYRSITSSDISNDQNETLQKLVDALEDLDDVQNVWY